MKSILESPFPQSHLLTASDFERFMKERGLRITIEDLEFYDKMGIIRPVMRLNRPRAEDGPMKYAGLFTDIFSIQRMYREGWIELPKDDDFQPWASYKDGYEEKTWLYYHPFQFVPVRRLTSGLSFRIGHESLMQDADPIKSFETMKKYFEQSVEISQKVAVESWIPRVRLLMLLEGDYLPYLGSLSMDFTNADFLNRWNDWRRNKFSPNEILEKVGMTIEQVKAVYDVIASEGHLVDPLASWYPLLQLIKKSMKKRLTEEALLAQEYYNVAKMVAFFIYDLTKEKVLDPDDIFDSNHANWKPRMYGNPFDYNSKKTHQLIVDHYFSTRPYRVAIAYEGDSEDVVIRKIFDALYIDADRHGIALYNAKGVSNLGTTNLHGLIALAKDNQIDVYVIADNDSDSKKTIENHKALGNIKDGMYTIWEKDFEYDNFGIDSVVAKVNSILSKQNLKPISKENVEKRMQSNNDVLMAAIDNVIGRENGSIRMKDILSKRTLAEELISSRVNAIRQERNANGWKPQMKIETVLDGIFKKYPFTL